MSKPRIKSELLLRAALATTLLAFASSAVQAQLPLSPLREAGQSVTPAYEGWYPNPDGTFSMSFGYYNRNTEQIVDLPIGPKNFFSPGEQDLGQPTHFHPLRHWGVFIVRVPADFGDQRLIWTLVNQGETYSIPGHLHPDWLLDAKRNPADGNTPPVIRLQANGPGGQGPDGVAAGPLEAKVGSPLPLVAWVTDDEVMRPGGLFRPQPPILLHWFEHRGPAEVAFEDAEPAPDKEKDGRAETSVTFSAPGEYVLRLRANDYSGVSSAGHAQCCWTNAFVKVTVTE
jgi:hypothetical protein